VYRKWQAVVKRVRQCVAACSKVGCPEVEQREVSEESARGYRGMVAQAAGIGRRRETGMVLE